MHIYIYIFLKCWHYMHNIDLVLYVVFLLVLYFETESHIAQLAPNSMHLSLALNSQSSRLYLPSAMITDIYHKGLLFLLIQYIFAISPYQYL